MRRKPKARLERRRHAASWLLSGAVHGLAVALLWRAAGRAPAAPTPVPEPQAIEITEFQITEGPPEPAARAVRPARPPTEPPPPPRFVRRPPERGPPRASPAEPPPPAGPPARAEIGQAPAAPRPDLSLESLAPAARDRLLGPAPDLSQAPVARPARPTVDEARAALEREEDAVANVQRGRVDPLLFDYLREARARFEDQAEQIAARIAVGPRETVETWSKGFLRRLEDLRRGEAEARDTSVDPNADPGGRRPDVLGQYEEARTQAAAGAEERRAEVCVTVAPGHAATVTLRRGSGNAALDGLAVESFRRATTVRDVPPDARAGLACYELRIRAFRMPPLPAISCGVDRHGRPTCVWPFKKVTSVAAHLISVDYARPGAAAVRPSLLRRPR
jgi:hypothetical protein